MHRTWIKFKLLKPLLAYMGLVQSALWVATVVLVQIRRGVGEQALLGSDQSGTPYLTKRKLV